MRHRFNHGGHKHSVGLIALKLLASLAAAMLQKKVTDRLDAKRPGEKRQPAR